MPYIPDTLRPSARACPRFPGELAFKITKTLLAYLGPKPRFSDFSEALGVLEATKLELYRRMIAPYEDAKKEENGDVYP